MHMPKYMSSAPGTAKKEEEKEEEDILVLLNPSLANCLRMRIPVPWSLTCSSLNSLIQFGCLLQITPEGVCSSLRMPG